MGRPDELELFKVVGSLHRRLLDDAVTNVVEEDKGNDIDKACMLNKRDRNPTAVVIAVDRLREIELRGYNGEH